MARPIQQLHDWREPAPLRPAATILLLRDTDQGLQVLMTRRSHTASFAPGAYVFPGGALDATDGSERARALSRSRGDQVAEIAGFATAAAREAFEELGILLACDAQGAPIAGRLTAELDRSHDGDLFGQLEARNWRLSIDHIWWFSHWIADRDLPKRFDARFFIARMPDDQTPHADNGEQFEPTWVTPADGLARHERGDFEMIFPTIRTLRQLTRFGSVAHAIDHCRNQTSVWTSNPRAGMLKGRIERFCEDEPPYGELELVIPDGRPLHTLDWQHERPVQLLKNLWRLTAPNPGRMTGPGTNTYIIGSPRGYIVVDPGPADFAHVSRIHAMVGKALQAIVCTHAHSDHVPGSAILKSLTGAPVLGRPTGPDFNPALKWVPERTLHDGDRLRVGDTTLRIIHTPGHTEHHLCLLMEEDELLISGDHILNGSTTVITPPDGNMRDYLASLERLKAEPFTVILPAHGHVLGRAKYEVDRLISHRLMRENKVIGALYAYPNGTLDDLVQIAYDDTPKVLWPVAKNSLLAHLLKLREEGRADHVANERWYPRD